MKMRWYTGQMPADRRHRVPGGTDFVSFVSIDLL
jgi:hypothetical protein